MRRSATEGPVQVVRGSIHWPMELIREHKDIDRDVCRCVLLEGTCDSAYKLGLSEAQT